jgi:hypothetical protein
MSFNLRTKRPRHGLAMSWSPIRISYTCELVAKERSASQQYLISYGLLQPVLPVRFGGTDGAFHYNDTWCLDLNTRLWTELQCIGYIPVPREGHSAALVDDVMYVFGGRDVGGKDLGDLAAFKFTSEKMQAETASRYRADG